MKPEEIRIGMKVMPFAKSDNSYGGKDDFEDYLRRGSDIVCFLNEHKYLVVVRYSNNRVELSYPDGAGADYFKPWDIRKFLENVE